MKYISIILLLIGLCACGFSRHIGNENLTPDKVSAIQKGVSTKTDVLTLLGPPQMTRKQKIASPSASLPAHLAADETWSYWSNNVEGSAVVLPFYAQTTTKSSNYILTIFFDSAGTVMDTQETQTQY